MEKLVEMAARVLRTGQAERMAGPHALELFDSYAERVSDRVKALRQEQAAALAEGRRQFCR
jgi:hypothetical protein